ncbi:MAG TPA: AI-2E family transporter [Verrucomicrobiota bacterium]|nr:AI-2E family transporter [Verrucomicrobiota bacterium]HNU52165.1 AI-2E family transporter [Verrucomicrobiota bacterium]
MKAAEQRLGWLALTVLLGGCLLVTLPLVPALVWAGILSFSIWPLYSRLLNGLGGRRGLAALLVVLGIVGVVFMPLLLVGVTLTDNVRALSAATQHWLDVGPPAPPAWLEKTPVVGRTAAESWKSLQADSAQWLEQTKRLVEPAGAWLLKAGFLLGQGLLQLALSLLVTFFLLRSGPTVATQLSAGVARIAGERGGRLLDLAGETVRGVVYGILGTALVQAVLAGLGLLIAGVPGPGLLAMMVFPLSVVPAGPFLIMLVAALWLLHQGATGWAVFVLVWGVGVSTVDNFVRPWLISQGSDMPFVLILIGVLGGALTFGLIGVFIGPTLLAVGQRIVGEWIATGPLTSRSMAGMPRSEPSP